MHHQRLNKITLLLAVLQVIVSHTVAAPEIKSTADRQFDRYLLKKMEGYGEWILSNNLDPSPPVPDTVNLPWHWEPRLEMNCMIRQQTMSGHSNMKGDVPIVGTQFSNHNFAIGREEIRTSYDIRGIYNCNGVLAAYQGLGSDLHFQGEGNFTVQVKSGIEVMTYNNFGITENHEFNTKHSWYYYLYRPIINQVKFSGGTWNSSTVEAYSSLIREGFSSAYSDFLFTPSLPQAHLNPARQIFIRFVDELVRTANLTEILSGEELPEPYLPSPTPTTTTTTTTSPTTDTDSPTPTTTEGSGASNPSLIISSFKQWLMCLAAAFLIKNVI